MIRMSALDLPDPAAARRRRRACPAARRSPSSSTCPPARSRSTLVPLDADGPGLALGTAPGRRQAGHHRLPRPPRLGGHRAARRRPVVGAVDAARRRRGPRLRHHRRPAAALPRVGGAAAGPRGRRHGRHPARRRRVGGLLRRGRPRRRQRRRHLGRLVRRPARHRAGRAQGDAVRRVPAPRAAAPAACAPPVPAGEDALVLAWVGAAAGPRVAARTASRSSCPRPPASATAPARPTRRSSRGSARRCADARVATRTPGPPNRRVTQSLPAGGAGALRCVCKRFYLGPGSLIAEADNPSRRDQRKWRRAMALNSKRRIAALTGVLAVALTATACGSSDDTSGDTASSGGNSTIDCAPYKAFGDLKGKTVSVYTSITAPEDAPHQASYKPFEECTGVTIKYEGSKEFEAQLPVRVKGGNAPDIAYVPQPGLLADPGRDRRGQGGPAGGRRQRRQEHARLEGLRHGRRQVLRRPARRQREVLRLVLAAGVQGQGLRGPEDVGRAARALRQDRRRQRRRRQAVVRRHRVR